MASKLKKRDERRIIDRDVGDSLTNILCSAAAFGDARDVLLQCRHTNEVFAPNSTHQLMVAG